MKEKILNYIEQHREQILSDVLLLIKTEAPSSDIEGLTEVRKVLKQLIVDRTGVLAEEIEVDSGRNVLYLPSKESVSAELDDCDYMVMNAHILHSSYIL